MRVDYILTQYNADPVKISTGFMLVKDIICTDIDG
jgi:hypothetical protein